MLNIKEIAELVSKKIYVEDGLLLSKFISEKFAEALIAEIAKQNEPVGTVSLVIAPDTLCVNGKIYKSNQKSYLGAAYFKPVKHGDALYALPPTASQIEQETAEAIARMLENGSFLTPESRVALAANGAAKAIRSGAWKEFKKS